MKCVFFNISLLILACSTSSELPGHYICKVLKYSLQKCLRQLMKLMRFYVIFLLITFVNQTILGNGIFKNSVCMNFLIKKKMGRRYAYELETPPL